MWSKFCRQKPMRNLSMDKYLFTRIILALSTMLYIGVAGAQDNRQLTEVGDGLYRFQNNFHFSMVLVTEEGVLVTDPINPSAAQWLKDEIASRFDKPIKYLVYSHDHVDHISGGEIFNAPVVISHVNARKDIIGEGRPTAVPNLTFSDTLTIQLGGQQVELSHVGRSHSDNMIVMNFKQQRVLFAVDFIPIKAVAWKTLTDAYIPDWIDAVKMVEGMDFDTLMPGHGGPGNKDDVTAFREYMEDLHDAVLTGVREGKTLEELQASIALPGYADWFDYDSQFSMNIEGMYNHIVLHRRGN
jgi:glyoxylase-like metal-dependent hydrolase (beta-lactamase superfamily II)